MTKISPEKLGAAAAVARSLQLSVYLFFPEDVLVAQRNADSIDDEELVLKCLEGETRLRELHDAFVANGICRSEGDTRSCVIAVAAALIMNAVKYRIARRFTREDHLFVIDQIKARDPELWKRWSAGVRSGRSDPSDNYAINQIVFGLPMFTQKDLKEQLPKFLMLEILDVLRQPSIG